MLDNHVGQLPLVAEAANDLPIFCNDVWLGALQFAQQDQPRVDDENPADVAQLCAAAGISTGMLSKVESGATSPSLATLYALAT